MIIPSQRRINNSEFDRANNAARKLSRALRKKSFGGPPETRTPDPLIKSRLPGMLQPTQANSIVWRTGPFCGRCVSSYGHKAATDREMWLGGQTLLSDFARFLRVDVDHDSSLAEPEYSASAACEGKVLA